MKTNFFNDSKKQWISSIDYLIDRLITLYNENKIDTGICINDAFRADFWNPYFSLNEKKWKSDFKKFWKTIPNDETVKIEVSYFYYPENEGIKTSELVERDDVEEFMEEKLEDYDYVCHDKILSKILTSSITNLLIDVDNVYISFNYEVKKSELEKLINY